MKLGTAIQQRAGDRLHHSSLLHPNHQVPLGKVGLKVALKKSDVRAARKSWFVFSIAVSFLQKKHFFQDVILI